MHGDEQQDDQAAVGGEDLEAARGHGGVDEAEDAERCEVDNPAHDAR